MNKKGQVGMAPDSGSNVHPVLIIGIFIFVIPFFSNLLPFTIPNWISGWGIAIILIGAGLSIWKNM